MASVIFWAGGNPGLKVRLAAAFFSAGAVALLHWTLQRNRGKPGVVPQVVPGVIIPASQ